MTYPKNDLWSVRQIEFLRDALDGYDGKPAIYYPNKKFSFSILGIETYTYVGVVHFPNKDRTIVFEQGDNYGLQQPEIEDYLNQKNIQYSLDEDT